MRFVLTQEEETSPIWILDFVIVDQLGIMEDAVTMRLQKKELHSEDLVRRKKELLLDVSGRSHWRNILEK